MIIVLVIVFYVFLFIIDGYPVIKKYKSKKAVAYIIIFAAAFLLNILYELKVKIPNPSEGIKRILELIIA